MKYDIYIYIYNALELSSWPFFSGRELDSAVSCAAWSEDGTLIGLGTTMLVSSLVHQNT